MVRGKEDWQGFLRLLSLAMGGVVALAGALPLAGWLLDLERLKRLFLGRAPMALSEALCLLLAGMALFFLTRPGRRARLLAQGLGASVLLLGLLGVGVYVAGLDRAVDGAVRLTLPLAIGFLLLGGALMAKGRRRDLLADSLALVAFVFLYVGELVRTFEIAVPSIPTTRPEFGPLGNMGPMLLCLGLLCARPSRGVTGVLAGKTPGGMMARRTATAILVAPPLLGWLWMAGERAGLLNVPYGVFLVLLPTIVLFLALVVIDVRRLDELYRERLEAVAALRESEARSRQLAAIVEASQDAISSVEPWFHRITFWNRGAEQLWGWSREEALGQPPEFLLPLERREEARAIADRVRRGEAIGPYEAVGVRKDGSWVDVSVSIFPVEDAEGRVLQHASITRDITARKRALEEAALRTAELKKAEELHRLKDHFLSTISHEMKTPLSLIVGYTELLEDTGADKALVAGIQDGSRRLGEHIDSILDYSALISGTMPLYRTEVSPEEVARQVVEAEGEGFRQQGLSLALDVSPGTPAIMADARRVGQMLRELVDNARKVTPAGGHVGIRVAPSGREVRFDVWDTGPGIPEADFPRIWEAFSQIDVGDAARLGGLGLGLTIVKRLVELHGGRVGLVSRVGEGSTFSIYLPVGEEEAPAGPRPAQAEQGRR